MIQFSTSVAIPPMVLLSARKLSVLIRSFLIRLWAVANLTYSPTLSARRKIVAVGAFFFKSKRSHRNLCEAFVRLANFAANRPKGKPLLRLRALIGIVQTTIAPTIVRIVHSRKASIVRLDSICQGGGTF